MSRCGPTYALVGIAAAALVTTAAIAQVGPKDGRTALLSRSYIEGSWTASGFDRLWRAAGETSRPPDLAGYLRARYGLHPAPYENGGLPMGLRKEAGSDRI